MSAARTNAVASTGTSTSVTRSWAAVPITPTMESPEARAMSAACDLGSPITPPIAYPLRAHRTVWTGEGCRLESVDRASAMSEVPDTAEHQVVDAPIVPSGLGRVFQRPSDEGSCGGPARRLIPAEVAVTCVCNHLFYRCT